MNHENKETYTVPAGIALPPTENEVDSQISARAAERGNGRRRNKIGLKAAGVALAIGAAFTPQGQELIKGTANVVATTVDHALDIENPTSADGLPPARINANEDMLSQGGVEFIDSGMQAEMGEASPAEQLPEPQK